MFLESSFNAKLVIMRHQQVAAGAGCGRSFGLPVFKTVCAGNVFSGRGDVFLLLTNLSKSACNGEVNSVTLHNVVYLMYQGGFKRSDVVILDEITHLTPCGASWLHKLDRCLETYGRLRQDPFQCKGCASPNLRWLSWIAYAIKPLGIYSVTLWTAQKVEKDKLASLLKIWMSFGVLVACISPSIKTSKTVTDVFGPREMEFVEAGRNIQLSESFDMKYYYLLSGTAILAFCG